jgi:hypothetical protein
VNKQFRDEIEDGIAAAGLILIFVALLLAAFYTVADTITCHP